MNSIKLLVVFVFVFVFVSKVLIAQETAPNYLLYKYNMNILNPAYAGANEFQGINIGFRRESLDFENDPVTQMASYSKALKKNIGLGLSIVNDKIFINRQTNFTVDFSYKLKLDGFTNLYLGLKTGGAMYKIDFRSLEISNNDQVFLENVSTYSPIAGAGFYLKGKRYFVNLSFPNLILSTIQKPRTNNGNIISEATNEKLYIYFGGAYQFIINENLGLTSSIFSRLISDDNAVFDISTTADISNLIEFGITYRTENSIIGSVLLKLIDKLHFGYSYESIYSDFSLVSTGTHEFIICFKFN